MRSVVCALDDDFLQWQCETSVPGAVAKINAAAGREVLRFDGFITMAGAVNAYEHGVYLIYGDSKLTMPTLGSARPSVEGACITRVRTAINPVTWQSFNAPAVMLHEMVHAIGFDHAAESNLMTVECPTVNGRQATDHLTAGDINAVRAVYGAR